MKTKTALILVLVPCLGVIFGPLFAEDTSPIHVPSHLEEPANIIAPPAVHQKYAVTPEEHAKEANLAKEHAIRDKHQAQQHKSLAIDYKKANQDKLSRHHEELAKHYDALAKEYEKTAITHKTTTIPKK